MGGIVNGFEDRSKMARRHKGDRERLSRVPPAINDVYLASRDDRDAIYRSPRDNHDVVYIAPDDTQDPVYTENRDSHGAMLYQTPNDNQDRMYLAPRDTHDPQTSANTMYRWAMWRMYLNEDMSRAISQAHAPNKMTDRHTSKPTRKPGKKSQVPHNSEHSVSNIASVYLRHRDAMAYGRMMKDLSSKRHKDDSAMERMLPDNFYLVYGLPRVSLDKTPPKGVREIYASAEKLERHKQSHEREFEDNIDTDKYINNINKLFDFVTEEAQHDQSLHLQTETKGIRLAARTNGVDTTHLNTYDDKDASVLTIEPKCGEPRGVSRVESRVGSRGESRGVPNGTPRDSPSDSQRDDKDHTDTPASIMDKTDGGNALPLVSKSRLFWEKLANSKSEIIKTERNIETKQDPPVVVQSQGISSDVLLRQHQMLKKTKPKSRSSRDLWQTVRDRKHDILQLRDWDLDHEPGENRRPGPRKRENKTSQLWGFIFSKKKELVQMKRNKTENVHVQREKVVLDRTPKSANTNAKNDNNMVPENFQDNFQKELEARLKKFRDRAEQNT